MNRTAPAASAEPQASIDAITEKLTAIAAAAPNPRAAMEAFMTAYAAVSTAHAIGTYDAGMLAVRVGWMLIEKSLQPGHGEPIH